MKFRSFCSLVTGIVSASFGTAFFILDSAQAAPEVFTIDSSQSRIALSGAVAGFTFSPQGPGSLTNTYSGNINADISGSTIQFIGSSAITAKTNGVWQPAVGGGSGGAPADYGAKVTVSIFTGYGAARNVVLDLTSPLLTVTGTNFDSSALVFSFTPTSGASFDYNAVFTSGSLALAGNSTNTIANAASLTTDGVTQRLVINLNPQFSFTVSSPGDTPLTLTGQIVATNSLVAPFMISSIALSNQNVVLNVQNATLQSQLQSSTNLAAWTPASALVSSNAGITTFTAPMSGPKMYFRVQK